ncbi:hypothetical protein CDD81_6661 [Ophiocordyceps australis]|uniref:Protein MGR2 n=1 Tax=Ophiocordyceps australis TaxID=1399860 RepID=A0A2C5Y7L9_9HYPO|nr:hypothetical protein CDD81_6661 [Ophiocordyceps australis]
MPPVAAVNAGGHQHGHSNFDKLKMGALMGGTVGVIIGFIFGTVNIFRYGAGPSGIMRTLGRYMGASGATFGFFMSIGTVVRTDSDPQMLELYKQAQRRPIITMASPVWRRQSS